MWRLLVVLALCGASLAQGEQHAVSCNNITTVQNVSLTELQGFWVTRKVLQRELEYPGSKKCLLSQISALSDSRLGLTLESHHNYEDGEERGGIERYALKTIGENKGRWRLDSELRNGQENLLVSADPSSYLVLAICRPARQRSGQENNGIESIVPRVFIFARRQGSGGSGNLSEKNLAKITDDTVKTLGLENHQEESYQTDC